MAVARTIAEPTIEDLVRAINTTTHNYGELVDKFRQLEYRVDNFTPTTVKMNVTQNSKLLLGTVAVTAFIAGVVGYREWQRAARESQAQKEASK